MLLGAVVGGCTPQPTPARHEPAIPIAPAERPETAKPASPTQPEALPVLWLPGQVALSGSDAWLIHGDGERATHFRTEAKVFSCFRVDDQKRLAFSLDAEGTATLWDARTGAPIRHEPGYDDAYEQPVTSPRECPTPPFCNPVWFSPDGDAVITVGNARIDVWTRDGRREALVDITASFSPRGTYLFDGAEAIVEVDTGALVAQVPVNHRLEWSADERYVALSATEDSELVLFDLAQRAEVWRVPERYPAAFSPDGGHLLVWGEAEVRVLRAVDGTEMAAWSQAYTNCGYGYVWNHDRAGLLYLDDELMTRWVAPGSAMTIGETLPMESCGDESLHLSPLGDRAASNRRIFDLSGVELDRRAGEEPMDLVGWSKDGSAVLRRGESVAQITDGEQARVLRDVCHAAWAGDASTLAVVTSSQPHTLSWMAFPGLEKKRLRFIGDPSGQVCPSLEGTQHCIPVDGPASMSQPSSGPPTQHP